MYRTIVIASLFVGACADEASKANRTDFNQGAKLLELQSRIEKLEAENNKLKETQSLLAEQIMVRVPKPSPLPETNSAQRAKEATNDYNWLVLERRVKNLEDAR